jgi:NitT/TauT family transport system permease protein
MSESKPRTRRNFRRALSRLFAPLLFLVILLAGWDIAVTAGYVDEILLPRPWDILDAFVELWSRPDIGDDIRATVWETVAGFVLGSAIGIALASAASVSSFLKSMINPYAIALQVTPRIALAPVIIAWLGFGYGPKIVIAATLAFFPVFINALTGLTATDRDASEMFRSIGGTRLQTFVHLRMPSALPVAFAGLKTGLTLALIGAIVGEFVSADVGLGLLIQRFSFQVNMPGALAVVLLLTLLGLALYALMEFLDWMLVFWVHDSRMAVRTRRKVARAARQRRGQRAMDSDEVEAAAAMTSHTH